MEKKHPNKFKIIRSKNDIQKFSITDNQIFAVIHIEGAEAIGEDLSQLNLLYELGLRSIGPVWSRSNIFGNGVPFDFPFESPLEAGSPASEGGGVSPAPAVIPFFTRTFGG